MSRFDELELRNRRAIPWDALPKERPDRFGATVADAVAGGWRLISLFGLAEGHDDTRLVAILANDLEGRLGATSTVVGERYPALTPVCPAAHVFEREIAEQCGVRPEDHPALKPLRRHPPDHAPAGFATTASYPFAQVASGEVGTPVADREAHAFEAVAGDEVHRPALDREAYPFEEVAGDEVHEVAVGPVHAGIIEPGHFRFQAHGERVLHLDIMLGYQHRGVERLLETHDRDRAVLVAEAIAGDTVVGHAGAYCGTLEALARAGKTPRAQAIRGIALEIERLANHIGDLGALANDVAFLPAAGYCGRLRGECLNLLMLLSGNRYGRGLVRPGGGRFDLPPAMASGMRDRLVRLREELAPVLALLFDNASVQARFEGVGAVQREACLTLGFVGPVARACDVPRDVRNDHPWGVFRFAHIPVATAWAGDVLARALVRRLEIQRSLEFLIEQLAALPAGEARVACGALRRNELAVAMVEGWRGEIVHVGITDGRGRVRRWKVTDPSFHNWTALALAMPGNEISDFPLCNKSFNLSYAGHDL